jgi:hypothetical protein
MKCDVCGTEYTHTSGGPSPTVLAFYNAAGTITLPKTGHIVDPAVSAGEGIAYYYGRVAHQVGGNPNLAGAILLSGDSYNVGKTGDPILDLAVHVDAFANPTPYGLGGSGAPGVAAGPKQPPVVFGPPAAEGPVYVGTIPTGGVNSEWKASNPEQVQYADISADGVYSVVCDGAVPVYVGVGFAPGIATFADLKAGGVYGVNTAEVPVKAGQYLCFAHEGNPGNRMRASQR